MRGPEDGLRLHLFGGPRGRLDGTELELGPPQQRAMLALLLARAGGPVPLEELTAALWGDRPPASAAGILHRYASGLRRVLEPGRDPRSAGRWIHRAGGGYRFAGGADVLDVTASRAHAARARELTGAAAADEWVAALAPTAGVLGPGLDARIREHPSLAAIQAERHALILEATDALLAGGRGGEVLDTLRDAAGRTPHDEAVHARLIRVLGALGRGESALGAYREIRDRLAEVLGIEPGAELVAARDEVTGARTVTPPTQLPAEPAGFVGRERELAELARPAHRATVICGMGGVGKTSLAVRWAHRLVPRHPDGQLFVDLRGYDATRPPVPPEEALRGFLEALGETPAELPDGVDALARRYRELTGARRLLVVIDNARDAAQVRPLLGADPDLTTLVTSRQPLAGLAGVATLGLDVFTREQSVAFLAERLGAARIAAEPAAAEALVARCGGLALALAIVAARAAVNPGFRLADVAEEIDRARRLDGFDAYDPAADVRATFASSYRVLRPAAAVLFRHLALMPGPELSLAGAAGAAGLGVEEAAGLLAELTAAHLVAEPRPGRFALHDLLRDFAVELGEQQDDAATRREVRGRLFDHHLATAVAARGHIRAMTSRVPLPEPAEGVVADRFTGTEAALRWYDAERPALRAVVESAHRLGFDAHVSGLAWGLFAFQELRGHWHDHNAVQALALEAATRSGDPWWQANAHRQLAGGALATGEVAAARPHLDEALRLFREVGDERLVARTLSGLGLSIVDGGPSPLPPAALAEALGFFGQALDIDRASGRRADEASMHHHIGWTLSRQEDRLLEAASHYRQSIRLYQQEEYRYGEASVLADLARVYARRGDDESAIAMFHRAIAAFAALHEGMYRAEALAELGSLYARAGRPRQARESRLAALEVLADLDLVGAGALRDRVTEQLASAAPADDERPGQ